MRILGFAKLWPKLVQHTFTTFRFTRRDRDWEVGERVQVVYRPRSKMRSVLGLALIDRCFLRWVIMPDQAGLTTQVIRQHPEWDDVLFVTDIEAKSDGFNDRADMVAWVTKMHGGRNLLEPMHKFYLSWKQVWLYTKGQHPDIAQEWAGLTLKDGRVI